MNFQQAPFEFLPDLPLIDGNGHSYYGVIERELPAAVLDSEVFESNLPIGLRVQLNRILCGTLQPHAPLLDVG